MIIRGTPVGTTTPRPDWNQTDPRKSDYILNKPDVVLHSEQTLAKEQQAQARKNIGAAEETEIKSALAAETKKREEEMVRLASDVKEICRPRAGFIYPLATETVPDGFLLCNGAAYSRTDYAELFEAIGTVYGEGDGSTTFNVPNLSARVPVGTGEGYALGDMDGEAEHTLTVEEMPRHRHTLTPLLRGDSAPEYTTKQYTTILTADNLVAPNQTVHAHTGVFAGDSMMVGGDEPHNNMQPYAVVNYIIATGKGDYIGYIVDGKIVRNTSALFVTVSMETAVKGTADYTGNEIAENVLDGGVSYLCVQDLVIPMTVSGNEDDGYTASAYFVGDDGIGYLYQVYSDGDVEAFECWYADASQIDDIETALKKIIDDDVVRNSSGWSSQNTVDKLCPSFTETGTIVTCEPLEGYPLEVTHIENLISFADHSRVDTSRITSCTGGVHKVVFTKNFRTDVIFPGLGNYQKSNYLAPGTYVFSINQESTGKVFKGCYAVVILEDGTKVNLPDGQAVTLTQAGIVSAYMCSDSVTYAKGTEITFTVQIEKDINVMHLGKNLIPQPYLKGTSTSYGLTFTVNNDYSVTIDGTATAIASFLFLGKATGLSAQKAADVGIFEGETYTISSGTALPSGVSLNVFFYDAEGVQSPGSMSSAVDKSFTPGSGLEYIYAFLRIAKGVVLDNLTIYPMIEKGSVATEYEPYRKEEISGGTVAAYAGVNTFFVESGEVTVSGKKDPVKVIENLTNAIIALGGNV